jgi:hypothetical protein
MLMTMEKREEEHEKLTEGGSQSIAAFGAGGTEVVHCRIAAECRPEHPNKVLGGDAQY